MKHSYCNHKELEFVLDVPFDVKSDRGTKFGSLHRCRQCGISIIDPIPNVEEIPALYDLPAYYTQGASHMGDTSSNPLQRAILQLAYRADKGDKFDLKAEFDPYSIDKKILDIGCGGGKLLSTFSSAGFGTFGVDPDEKALAIAKDKGHEVFHGTAEDLPSELSCQKFGAITMIHSLEHCRDPELSLENVASLLSENGIFYCEVPNAGSIYFQTYMHISEMLDVPRHLYFFRKVDLEKMADSADLEIIDWRFRGLSRHFSPVWKNWENSIHDRLTEAGVKPTCPRRSITGDLNLLAKGLFKERELRYDCVGFLARRKGC